MDGDPSPRRVCVVGSPAAGKSTFARALAARLGVEHVEIDALFHGPGWTPAPDEVLRARVEERVAAPGWVVDGNYRRVAGPVLRPLCDTVVWLDLPKGAVMRSVVWRTLRRMALRKELWNGNRERFRNLFDRRPEENIVLWTWTQFDAYRRGYTAEMEAAPRSQRWLRFASRRAAWEWLESLPATAPALR